jgi:hypothetical protein
LLRQDLGREEKSLCIRFWRAIRGVVRFRVFVGLVGPWPETLAKTNEHRLTKQLVGMVDQETLEYVDMN